MELNRFVEITNKILQVEKIEEINDEVLKSIMELFNFDYVITSFIDFDQRKIVSSKPRIKDGEDFQDQKPDQWYKDSIYSLTSKDILSQVIIHTHTVWVLNKWVIDEKKIIGNEALNDDIFKKYHHDQLARIFVPITHLRKRNNFEQILVLGVIEMGLKNIKYADEIHLENALEILKDDILLKSKMKINEVGDLLNLFSNTVAISYFQLLTKDILYNKQNGIMIKFREFKTQLNFEQYAQNVLHYLTSRLNAEFGIISFLTFRQPFIDFEFNKFGEIYYSLPKHFNNLHVKNNFSSKIHLNRIADIVNEKRTSIFTQRSDLEGLNLISSIKIINEDFLIQSELTVPIISDDEVVGVISMWSKNKLFFNIIDSIVLEEIAREFWTIYIVKKSNYIFRQISISTDAWEKPIAVYKNIVNILQKYYGTEHVVVWLNNLEKANFFYLVNELLEEETKDIYFGKDINREEEKLVELMYSQKYIPNSGSLVEIIPTRLYPSTRNLEVHLNDKFSFIILIKIVVHNNYESLIMVLSKSPLHKIYDINKNSGLKLSQNGYIEKLKERDIEFLNPLENKISSSLQNLRILEAMTNMSASLVENNESMQEIKTNFNNLSLQKIVNFSAKATNADDVSIFPFLEHQGELLKKDVISSSQSISIEQIEQEKMAIFPNLILKNSKENSVLIFDNDTEFYEFLKKGINRDLEPKEIEDGFRFRNKIKSTICVSLFLEKIPLGVIIFNYKTQQNFKINNNLKKLIIYLSNFAGIQLYLFNSFKEYNREKLFYNEAISLYNNAIIKMEERIPQAAQESFYSLQEGINHEIKNLLYRLESNIIILLNKKTIEGKERRSLNQSLQSIRHASITIKKILNLFNFKSLAMINSNINSIIQTIVGFFMNQPENTIEFETNLDDSMPEIEVHEAEISMVFYNLLNNAVYVFDDNFIRKPKITITSYFKNNMFFIIIEDNGPGIRKEWLENDLIFQPGFTTKDSGTGIGLYYVRGVLKQNYNGKIICESILGKFTRFTITIPLHKNYL